MHLRLSNDTLAGLESACIMWFNQLTFFQRISGSSVSTALAAGISSLTLTCVRLAHLRKETAIKPVKWRHKTVKHYLEKMMAAESTKKHVLLEKFANIGDTGVGQGHRYVNKRLPSIPEFLGFFEQHEEKF